MAKKYSGSSKSSLKPYFESSLMNEMSDFLYKLRFDLYAERVTLEQVPLMAMEKWNELRLTALKSTSKSTVEKFDVDIQAVVAGSSDQFLSAAEVLINSFRRQSDVGFSLAKNQLLDFWNNCKTTPTKQWDVPWIRRIRPAEKFLPFCEKGERYIFKGYANQSIISVSMSLQNRSGEPPLKDPILVFMGDIKKIVESSIELDASSKDTADTQIAHKVGEIMRGVKSLTSVFVLTKNTSYKNSDGSYWKGENGEKRPSKDLIDSGVVEKHEVKSYTSNPVWCVESILPKLPQSYLDKFNELRDLRVIAQDRARVSAAVEAAKDHDINSVVDVFINETIMAQNIKASYGGNSAYYAPGLDSIQIPNKSDFINPVLRFAVVMHELAHSTMHLADRYSSAKFGSVAYAMEEVVAETVAVLMINDLYEYIFDSDFTKSLPNDVVSQKLPSWKGYFSDYYSISESYTHSWGEKFNFPEMISSMFGVKSSDTKIIDKLMENTLNAFQIVKTGLVNGDEITQKMRLEKQSQSLASEKTF